MAATIRGRRRLVAVVAIVAVAVVVFRPQQPDQPAEVTRDQLEMREGRMYLPDDTRPYSGRLVEWYDGRPGGQRRSELEVHDGRIDGLARGWHANGQCEVEEHFVKGVSHGTRTRWYPNGRMRSQASIVGGSLHGPFVEWHDNGTKAVGMNMVSGKADGRVEAWHPDGSRKSVVTMRHGEVVDREYFPPAGVTGPETAQSLSPR